MSAEKKDRTEAQPKGDWSDLDWKVDPRLLDDRKLDEELWERLRESSVLRAEPDDRVIDGVLIF